MYRVKLISVSQCVYFIKDCDTIEKFGKTSTLKLQ